MLFFGLVGLAMGLPRPVTFLSALYARPSLLKFVQRCLRCAMTCSVRVPRLKFLRGVTSVVSVLLLARLKGGRFRLRVSVIVLVRLAPSFSMFVTACVIRVILTARARCA